MRELCEIIARRNEKDVKRRIGRGDIGHMIFALAEFPSPQEFEAVTLKLGKRRKFEFCPLD